MSGNEHPANGSPVEPAPRPAAPRKRSASRQNRAQSPEQSGPEPAPFASLETQAANPEMWPARPEIWLEAQLSPLIPASSGLGIVRQLRIPAPGFEELPAEPKCDGHAGLQVCDPVAPQRRTPLPQSGLSPLGWNPRTWSDSKAAKGLNR